MEVTVKVEGLRELEEAMMEISTASAKAQGRKALKAGGEVMARRMRDLAPRDQGHLIESIDVGTKLTRRQKQLHQKQSDVEAFVGANDPAAVPQEFGWEGNPPQPFARPAFDGTQTQVLKVIGDTLAVGIDKAIKRTRRKALKAK